MKNPWDLAQKKKLHRLNPFGDSEPIERGVNFFVLTLEKLGAKTHWSCEGHPKGFYIVFSAPLKLARRIKAAGYFQVEVEKLLDGKDCWSLRLTNNEHHGKWTEREKRRCLRWAAAAWLEKL